ncbi:E3 ubiquitin-protein ligase RMA3-like [Iris pallida]|uniref:E3 ubiquitin-protein ligase RMA n=1 Tax=Iris pallida TaxID=29817 RepID=A0AAX6EPC8_IRIPA|nr:E3 ubiquitin-protein ligase RMA3-like [Iris pallida]
MDMACSYETVETCFSDQETSEKLGPSGPAAAAADDQPPPRSACFDCSICLDFPVDPAVTLCGHLYCWPCIYKWMQSPAASPRRCPVCKAPLSEDALIPLYGRGGGGLATGPKGSRKNRHLDVPKRPNVHRDVIASIRSPSDDDGYIDGQGHPAPRWGASVFGSTAGGVLGGLAVAMYPLAARSGHLARPYRFERSGSSPRERRREVLVEESLHQIWLFLSCAAVLCLLFF